MRTGEARGTAVPLSRRDFLKLSGSGIAGLAVLGASGCAGPAASYPSRPVELVIPFGPGGAADVAARKLIELSQDEFGEDFQASNVTGGGGAVAYNQVVNAAPDGYTVAWSSGALNTLAAVGNVEFGPDDFRHAAIVATETVTLAVAADAPWQNLRDFMEDAENNRLKVGNSGLGSFTHMSSFALADAAGVGLEHVPFGDSLAVTQVLGGQIDASVQHPSEILEQWEAEKIRILTLTSPEPIEAFEGVPTAREQGYDVVMTQWRGLSLAGDAPEEAVQRLRETFTSVARGKEWKEFAATLGSQVQVMGTEEMEDFVSEQYEKVQEIASRMDGD